MHEDRENLVRDMMERTSAVHRMLEQQQILFEAMEKDCDEILDQLESVLKNIKSQQEDR